MVLITEISQSEALGPVKLLRNILLIVGAITIVVGSAIGFIFIRYFNRSLQALTIGASEYGKGNLGYVIELNSRDEMGELARSFSATASKLSSTLVSRDKLYEEIETRKKFEQELKRSNAELENFAYVASHDLQEPLRVISNFASLISKRYLGKLDTSADDFIGFIVDGAVRMQSMIKDLLTFSRINTRGEPFTKTELKSIIETAMLNLSMAIEESGCTVEIGPLPVINCDKNQFVSLFQNLLSNSIKFHSEKKPVIKIDAIKSVDSWIINFKDNGIGIEKEYFEKIFVIFQKLHPSDEFPGTGIGLAICKKIVERHHGRIWVESGKDGSIFYINLPINIKEEIK